MDLYRKVEELMERVIRPVLKEDGGDARVVAIEDGIVCVEMSGACAGCLSADLDTKDMIEAVLKSELPEVKGVEISRAIDPELMDFVKQILSKKKESKP